MLQLQNFEEYVVPDCLRDASINRRTIIRMVVVVVDCLAMAMLEWIAWQCWSGMAANAIPNTRSATQLTILQLLVSLREQADGALEPSAVRHGYKRCPSRMSNVQWDMIPIFSGMMSSK